MKIELPLSPTLVPLVQSDIRLALAAIAEKGFRYVQLSAALPTMRPRELDRSARRDLLARLRRLELQPSGVDLFIPDEHFLDNKHCDRAISAVLDAIELAADLDRIPLSISLPTEINIQAIHSIKERAELCGVDIANFGTLSTTELGCGIDPALLLTRKTDPAKSVINATDLVTARFSDIDSQNNRTVPGYGKLDLMDYQISLVTCRYNKSVVLDLRMISDPWDAIIPAFEVWNNTGLVNRDDF